MALSAGTRLGPYEILSIIGAGGMGEVYRATDTKLKRQVAIKVLPPLVATNPDRLARFQREAEVLASLNHPHIAAIYGLEEAEGVKALVMELVEGPTLADRTAAGPLPLDEALQIARQMAEALETAHDHGVIHRDLKPSNVKVRSDGVVKVLDFGLAKALEPAAGMSGVSQSPTKTSPAMTHIGVILGTAAYMSPEQARGKPVDRRADIWAFGCVLFEMLAGRRPFPVDETVTDTIAGVLTRAPEWSALPANTPASMRALLERCLSKDVRRRLSHIAEARIAIEDTDATPVPQPDLPTGRRQDFVWPVMTLVAFVTAAVLGAQLLRARAPEAIPTRFDVFSPPGALPMTMALGLSIDVGEPISPDGRTVAFLAMFEGQPAIWTRRMGSPALEPLPETTGAQRHAWSPDGQFLAFFASGELKRVAVAGGPATPIVRTAARDVSWGPQSVILIGGEHGKPLFRVSPDGGEPMPATVLGMGETSHDYPHFLPDGRHFLYLARRGTSAAEWDTYVGRLDSNDRQLLRGIHSASWYSPSGHLLFKQDDVLFAVPFDLDRRQLTGDAYPVAQQVESGPRATFAVSRNGTLAYLTSAAVADVQLVLVDRHGRKIDAVGAAGEYNRVRLSRDGRMIAFGRGSDVFTLDIDRGVVNKMVSHAGADFSPVFSPAADAIVFASSREPTTNAGIQNIGAGQLYMKIFRAAGDGELLFSSDAGKTPTDWSRDGRYLTYTSRDDVWALPLPMPSGGRPLQVTKTSFAESAAVFSPDGQWIAYQSNESAVAQDVYVQSFPDGRDRYLVSVGGGSAPRWSSDGAELFYVSLNRRLMSVSVTPTADGLRLGKPGELFESSAFQHAPDYDVGAGNRFLLKMPLRVGQNTSVAVIVNWTPAKQQR